MNPKIGTFTLRRQLPCFADDRNVVDLNVGVWRERRPNKKSEEASSR